MTNFGIILATLVAFTVSYALTPHARNLSCRFGLVDKPNERKVHNGSIPRGGGIAIYLGFLMGFIFLGVFDREIVGFLLASFIIVTLGLFDDKFTLRASSKFIVQSAAALVAIYFGIVINMDAILVGRLAEYDMLAIPLTFLWLVGVTNAVNIIDGLDGLAGGITTIAAFAIAAVAFLSGVAPIGALALVVGFSSLGFLPHNFNSRIFMGDSGSLFLGFSLAALSIMGSLKLAAAFSMLVPIMILLIPLFDTSFAIFRRFIRRKPIFEGDKRHFHHRLLDLGFSPHQAVYLIYFISLIFAGLAVYSSQVRSRDAYIAFAISLIVLFSVTAVVVYLHQKKENHIG
jgi:UDP-GlcNAc:undecaprenyl-phosphate/decaprenyl-phosphate GlcNAc-1-phosphate transferase